MSRERPGMLEIFLRTLRTCRGSLKSAATLYVVRLLSGQKQEDRIVFEIHQNLMGRRKSNGGSFDASVPSAENASKVSHFLPSFRAPAGLSVAVRPLCSQRSPKKNTRRSLSGNVEGEKKKRRKHSRKDITSYVSVDGGRLKYQRPAAEENTWTRRKAIREESFWNPAERTPLVGRINHDPRE